MHPLVLPFAFLAFFHACAPNVQPQIIGSIVQQESGFSPWAIDDDTTHRSYYPRSEQQAVALSFGFARRGDTFDVGYMGYNSVHFLRSGLSDQALTQTLIRVFDPCTNVRLGATVLTQNYRQALARGYAPGGASLLAALDWYNGGAASSFSYAERVYRRAETIETYIPFPAHRWPRGAREIPTLASVPVAPERQIASASVPHRSPVKAQAQAQAQALRYLQGRLRRLLAAPRPPK